MCNESKVEIVLKKKMQKIVTKSEIIESSEKMSNILDMFKIIV